MSNIEDWYPDTNYVRDAYVDGQDDEINDGRPRTWHEEKFNLWLEQRDHEAKEWYASAAKHTADQLAEARATLQYFADRIDPFIFEELSSVLEDQPLDYETGSVIGKSKLRRSWHEGFCRGEVSGTRETPLNPYTENPYL